MLGFAFAYDAAYTFEDGSEQLVDLEVHGWADKDLLSRVRRFTLIPKAGVTAPVVIVNIPAGAKPVFKSRVFGMIGVNSAVPAGVTDTPIFRCYALGYKKGAQVHLTWVLPTGDIEVGPDPLMADAILYKLTHPEPTETVETSAQ